MKIYISGKMTGLEFMDIYPKFKGAEHIISELGHEPLNPVVISPYCPEKTWQNYMVDDIAALLNADAILMLPCWGQSKGARIERAIAQELDLKIYYDINEIKEAKQ